MGARVRSGVGLGFLLFGVMFAPRAAEAGPAADCSSLPRQRMRVHVAVSSTALRNAEQTIRDVVTRVWAREGIAIDWGEPHAVVKLQDVDAWILARHDQTVANDPSALGAATFIKGVPHPLIRLSIDAAIDWIQRAQANARGLNARLGRHMLLRLDDADQQTARTLGYTAAHELGHLWLGRRSHASSGLMRRTYFSLPSLDRDPAQTTLDTHSRNSLATRLASGAGCR